MKSNTSFDDDISNDSGFSSMSSSSSSSRALVLYKPPSILGISTDLNVSLTSSFGETTLENDLNKCHDVKDQPNVHRISLGCKRSRSQALTFSDVAKPPAKCKKTENIVDDKSFQNNPKRTRRGLLDITSKFTNNFGSILPTKDGMLPKMTKCDDKRTKRHCRKRKCDDDAGEIVSKKALAPFNQMSPFSYMDSAFESEILTKNVMKTPEHLIVSSFPSNVLSNVADLTTSFEMDDKLPEKKKITSCIVDDESPLSRKMGIGAKLHGCFKRSSVSSISIEPSFECLDDSKDIYSLPLVKAPQIPSRAFGSISGECLVQTMLNYGANFDKKFMLIDCRYPYEYKGGHIKGAINFYNTDAVSELFFPEGNDSNIKKMVPIFYCEFSQKRGPAMANALRAIDREKNVYPLLTFEEIYVLDRGYKKFFQVDKYETHCEPCGYVEMRDKKFVVDLKKYSTHHKSGRSKSKRNLQETRSTSTRSFEAINPRVLSFE
uniref:M-phase inducer phosphatase n=1 Tax=Parastrongyloides trichosuri TaxID=131310 RepID=A0A0N4ZSX5_PARTI